jgi:SAM-dependent methyltransferase
MCKERNLFLRPWLTDPEYWITKLRREDLEGLACRFLRDGRERVVLDFGARQAPYQSIFVDGTTRFLKADLAGGDVIDVEIGKDGRLRHPSESVDLVLSLQVLEHVPDAPAYLEEAHRVLKPGGLLWLTTHGIWPYHPTPEDFHRWTLSGLRRLVKARFEVIDTDALMGGPAYAFMIYLHMFWEGSLRINQAQARGLNRLTGSRRWGKEGPRRERIECSYAYAGSLLFKFLAVPLNLVMVGMDRLTPRSVKTREAAVYRIAARKRG